MIEWLKRKLSGDQTGSDQSRAIDPKVINGIRMFLMDRSNSSLSESQILDELHENPIFYSCVSLIASQIAGTDIYPMINGEIARTHPVARKLANPNRFHSQYTFFWLLAAYSLTVANVYIYVYPNGNMIPVSPTRVTHQGGFQYQVQIGSATYTATMDKNLVKISTPDLREPCISGTGIGAAINREVSISAAAQKHELSTLENNARPDLLVNLSGASVDAVKKYGEDWAAANKGPENAGKTSFLSAERMDVEALNSSFSDMGFIELREHSNDTIRRTFGIPPELLGKSENSNRATIDAAFFVFAKMVLKPQLRLLLDGLNAQLLPLITTDRSVYLVHEEVVPENNEFALEVMKEFPQAYSINDARKLTGHQPVAGGDRPLVGDLDVSNTEETPVRAEISPRAPLGNSIKRISGSMPEELYFAALNRELINQKKLTYDGAQNGKK